MAPSAHGPTRCPAGAGVVLSAAVRDALARGRAVVALESTLIAHGLPHPEGLWCARALEAAVAAAGAVPATVAVLDGVLRAGLSPAELQRIARPAPAPPVLKLGLRDVGRAIAARATGATTVSATMHIAALAGIRVFATGGVGGVHRGPLDVSQDILALATRPVLVVSAGVKSVLDVRATLEALEAAAVPVLVWRASRFPAFYVPDSGLPAPAVVTGAREAAAVFCAALSARSSAGMLLAVPVPQSAAASTAAVEKAVEQALRECEIQGVAGKDVTPFLLRRVAEISGGESLRANVALAVNNATVAAQVAVELAAMENEAGEKGDSGYSGVDLEVVVAGVAAVDVLCKPHKMLVSGSSSPGRVVRELGGVACNVARAAASAGINVVIVAAVGDDEDGAFVREMLQNVGVGGQGLVSVKGGRTPTYCAMHDESGDLKAAVADMDRADGEMEIAKAARQLLDVKSGPRKRMFALDANLSAKALRALCENAKKLGAVVWFEPTSVPKAVRIVRGGALPFVDIMSPNVAELVALGDALGGGKSEAQCARKVIDAGVDAVVVTRGKRGAALYMRGRGVFEVPAELVAVQNTSGAGDALAGAMIAHIARFGNSEVSLRDALRVGVSAATKVCARDNSGVQDRRARL